MVWEDLILMRFKGKVAVITAAASGICRAAAVIIAKEGGVVVGIDTDEARLEKMSMELSQEPAGSIVTYCIDALDPEAADKALENIIKNNKRIDILINGVGGSTIISNPSARVDELTVDEWQAIINFNLKSMFILHNNLLNDLQSLKTGITITCFVLFNLIIYFFQDHF